MKGETMHGVARGVKLVVLGAVALSAVALIVMSLWNWLVPALFGGQAIGFWQALGLFALCRLLFGSFGGSHRHSHWRQHWERRWANMTPEERERFREGLRARCGRTPPAAGEAGQS